jgi:hypothetical protein
MFRLRLVLSALAFLACPVHAAIVVDGKPDEPEWQTAQRFDHFKVVQPNTQGSPALHTEARLLATPQGIYVAFICDQPKSVPRTRTRHQRDQGTEVDRVTLAIDFEGSGHTAYGLTLAITNSIRDSVLTPVRDAQANSPITFNYDWDGDWDHATSESEDQWFAEMRIPWTMAPMGASANGERTIGLWFSRFVSVRGERYAEPAIIFERPTFIADLARITVKDYPARELDVFPYAAGLRDFVDHRWKARAGLDVFWKPLPQHQLTATINPDFGQVESDDIIVNFSAIPTFFPDKRPFFTENLGLFSTENRVLYTRRIGAAPDAGPEGSTDIIGAAKYTGSVGPWDLGLITAFEDDSDEAKGRQFYVGRVRGNLWRNFSFGWLGTHVERPTLDRRADVNAIDFNWTASAGLTILGQAMHSQIQRSAETASTPLDPSGSGEGGTLGLRYSGAHWEHATGLVHFDRSFQLDDAGFLERNNLNQLSDISTYHWRTFPDESRIQETSLYGVFTGSYNDQGDKLQAHAGLSARAQLRNNSAWILDWHVDDFGGVDDLVTRGNGPVSFPPQNSLFVSYVNPQVGFFRYVASAGWIEGLFAGQGWELTFKPEFYFSERLVARFMLDYLDEPDFSLWPGFENVIATFRYRQAYFLAGLDWFPADRHELRARLQWSGGTGDVRQAYRPDASGDLQATDDAVQSFSFSDVALQVRYRYELAPQSDLFVVYSRGGDVSRDDTEHNLPRLLTEGAREQSASQILVKVRYRFRLF